MHVHAPFLNKNCQTTVKNLTRHTSFPRCQPCLSVIEDIQKVDSRKDNQYSIVNIQRANISRLKQCSYKEAVITNLQKIY